jgi:acyl carrier protein
VVHLGRVSDIGYIQGSSNGETLVKAAFTELKNNAIYPISERDLHNIFAGAILDSPADSGVGPEIITGIRDMDGATSGQFALANAPMFAHLVNTDAGTLKPTNEQKLPDRKELSKQLTALSELSESEIRVIITDAFSRKLGALLQLDDIDEDRNLLALGIDSLVATEIGSWAKKELRVQISHPLIFGGASMKETVYVAISRLDRG